MRATYVVGLGRVGALIIDKMLRLGLKPEESIAQKLVGGRYPEIQIFDMAREEVVNGLIRDGYINEYDQFIQIQFADESLYKLQNIYQNALIYKYYNLLRYRPLLDIWLADRLKPGEGVKRFRPLSRFYTTLSLRDLINYINQDFRDDLEPLLQGHNPTLVNIYVLSPGGGFGSGAIHNVALAANYVAETAPIASATGLNIKHILFLSVPLGSTFTFKQEDTPFTATRYEDALASIGALFLELMFLNYLKYDKRSSYKDETLEHVATSAFNIRPDTKVFSYIDFDQIIMLGLAGKPGATIEEVFEHHDNEAGAILSSIIAAVKIDQSEGQNILKSIMDNAERPSIIGTLYQAYRMDMGSEGTPRAALYLPVDIASIRFIRLDKKSIKKTLEELDEIATEINSKKKTVNRLMQNLKDLETKLRELDEKLGKLRSLQNNINNIETNALTLKKTSEELKQIHSNVDELSQMLSDLEALAANLVSLLSINSNKTLRGLHNINAIITRINAKINVLSNNINIFINEFNNVVAELNKYVNMPTEDLIGDESFVNSFQRTYTRAIELNSIKTLILNQVFNKLVQVYHYIETIRNEADTACKRIGILERILGPRTFCKIRNVANELLGSLNSSKSNLENLLVYISKVAEEGTQRINSIKSTINKSIDEYATARNKIVSEINSVRSDIDTLETEINKLIIQYKRNFYEKLIRSIIESFTIERRSLLTQNIINRIYNSMIKSLEEGIVEDRSRSRIMEHIKAKEEFSVSDVLDLIKMLAGEDAYDQVYSSIKEHLRPSNINPNLTINNLVIDYITRKRLRTHSVNVNKRIAAIIYTPDNESLADRLKHDYATVLGEEPTTVKVDSEKYSFIGVLVKNENVPLIAINEACQAIKEALTKENVTFHIDPRVDDAVRKLKNGELSHEQLYILLRDSRDVSGGEGQPRGIQDFKGKRFMALDVYNSELNWFLENVAKEFEDLKKNLGGTPC